MFNTGTIPYSVPVAPLATGCTDGCNRDGLGDNGAWWIIVFVLFFAFGGWGNGFGWGGNNGRDGYPCATQADVRAAVDQQTLISKLDQQTYGLADSTYALNNAITNGFHGVDNALCSLGYNMQAGFNGLQHSIDSCCCTTQRAIDSVKYENAKNTCDIIRAGQDNTRAILDFLTQDKIATLTAENQALKFQASQTAQNAFISNGFANEVDQLYNRLSNCPVPTTPVYGRTPIFTCNSNNRCGCGCGFNGTI